MSEPKPSVSATIVIPHALGTEAAIARLCAADEQSRTSSSWPRPEAIGIAWTPTGGTVSGRAFGFLVNGTIVVTDIDVTIDLVIPWTGKALLANFRPPFEAYLTRTLA